MRPSSLWHISLNDGCLNRSPRSAVSHQALADVARILERAVEDGAAEILPGHVITPITLDEGLVTTLYGPEGPLLTSVVAASPGASARLWPALHRATPFALPTRGTPAPRAPWCADLVWPSETADAVSAPWTCALTRHLAWVWIDRRGAT